MITKNQFVARTSFLLCTILIMDMSCSSNDDPEPVDCNTSDLAVQFTPTHPSACGARDGALTLTATGGTEPYTFSLNNGAFDASANFTALGAGVYTVAVKDRNGCESTSEATLQVPASTLVLTLTADESGCKTSNGSITAEATGGVGPYEFQLNDDGFGTNAQFASLPAGSYSVSVRDSEGCTTTSTVRMESGVSFANDIKPLIDTKCAATCHASGGQAGVPFLTYNQIKAKASQIKTLTGNGSMPKGGPELPQAEKDMIACWVDDGALDN